MCISIRRVLDWWTRQQALEAGPGAATRSICGGRSCVLSGCASIRSWVNTGSCVTTAAAAVNWLRACDHREEGRMQWSWPSCGVDGVWARKTLSIGSCRGRVSAQNVGMDGWHTRRMKKQSLGKSCRRTREGEMLCGGVTAPEEGRLGEGAHCPSAAPRDGPDFAAHRRITAHGCADLCLPPALPSTGRCLIGGTWN